MCFSWVYTSWLIVHTSIKMSCVGEGEGGSPLYLSAVLCNIVYCPNNSETSLLWTSSGQLVSIFFMTGLVLYTALSGFCSRGGKHLVPKFKRVAWQILIQGGGNPILKEGKATSKEGGADHRTLETVRNLIIWIFHITRIYICMYLYVLVHCVWQRVLTCFMHVFREFA